MNMSTQKILFLTFKIFLVMAALFYVKAYAEVPLTAESAKPNHSESGSFGVIESEAEFFRIEHVMEGLQVPWALAFLPDGTALVSERAAGAVSLIDFSNGTSERLGGIPEDVYIKINAGMLDIVLHPNFPNNRWVYYCYTAGDEALNTMVVERAIFAGNHLTNRQRIFEALPWYHNAHVYGCRLAFQDDYVFVTMGDRWDMRHLAQSPGTHIGKTIRIFDDGRVPEDNPFVGMRGALPEVWSIGNRNAQGLVVHPITGDLWEHEHGPLGGDEVNVIEKGRNYGWPVISYGKEYGGQPIIHIGRQGNTRYDQDGLTEMEGMEQPLHTYIPSIAPSDMFFYTGSAFPGWKGNLFLGALSGRHLNRLVVDDREVLHEERLLEKQGWRIRLVKQGLDDFIYLGTDEGDIYRLVPQNK
ncbi:MAG: hypothetical protein CMO98_11520 [Woeseia sp.]|nr:hypothetical protein [Woeseia sp.]